MSIKLNEMGLLPIQNHEGLREGQGVLDYKLNEQNKNGSSDNGPESNKGVDLKH